MTDDPLNQGGAVQSQTEEDLRSAVGATTDENPSLKEQVWNDALDRVRNFQHDTEHYVRQNPVKAVFTALGFGFVLGFVFRRR